jgi:hypothetical protein
MIDVDIWLRGRTSAATHAIGGVGGDAAKWTDGDVRRLLVEMLLALEKERNPGDEPPQVSLRGFSWIVSPVNGGVLVHLEMQSGTASAGPFGIAESQLTEMISRVVAGPAQSSLIH